MGVSARVTDECALAFRVRSELWRPGAVRPAWLDGSLPGDRGLCVSIARARGGGPMIDRARRGRAIADARVVGRVAAWSARRGLCDARGRR